MRVAYVRVSSEDQNEARQVSALSQFGIEKWFSEKVSAKDSNRPQLKAMLDFVRDGDAVYVHDFSRLARNTADLISIASMLQEKNVTLNSYKEKFDTTSPTGKFMLTTIGAIAEFERDLILERQREGIAIAKKRGVYKGRKKIIVDDIPCFERCYRQYMRHEMSKSGIARYCKVSRTVVDRLISEIQAKEKKPGLEHKNGKDR